MPRIIKDGGIVDDSARIIGPDEQYPIASQHRVFLPLSAWLSNQSAISNTANEDTPVESRCHIGSPSPGVWFDSDEDISALLEHLEKVPAIAIHFISFVDGTGFSVGAQLRESYGFVGELRAFGHIIADQVPPLRRCGFNAIALQPGESLEMAMSMLEGMNLSYQGSIYSPRTPFKFRF